MKVETRKVETPKVKIPKRVEAPKLKALKIVKVSAEASAVAAKNQEAAKTTRVPGRLDVEPGRYDMLLS